MYKGPFDFNRDGKLDSFEKAAEFAFLNDLLKDEDADDCDSDLFGDSASDDGWDD